MKKAAKKKFQIYCETCLKIIFTFSLDFYKSLFSCFASQTERFPWKKKNAFCYFTRSTAAGIFQCYEKKNQLKTIALTAKTYSIGFHAAIIHKD